MEKCNQVCEKKRGFYYVDELCGNIAKWKLSYTLQNKLYEKIVCNRHLKSNEAWLNRINTNYEKQSITE